uniref:Glutamine amidotransferase type-2 domain-containing protein n=1 Tax=viral metagenome TaxID=1070528 RepID=A0A6C0K0K1_9ZZZZ
MCRLFFSFRNKSIKTLLEEFLAQSVHKTKNTPNLNNHRDHINHTDGFGIAWKSVGATDWDVYKQPKLYTEDAHLDSILDTIPNNLVIAHIRKKTQGNVSMENTHPFHYDGQIFAQNGKIAHFEKHIELLRSYIQRSLLRKIVGETDTECLFFMFLSCKKYLEYRNKHKPLHLRKNSTRKTHSKSPIFTKHQIELYEKVISNITLQSNETQNANYINAFTLLVGIFREQSIELVANIIYSNSTIVLFSRYIFYDKTKYDEKQIPTSLYWNKCRKQGDNGILITSEPLSKYDSVLFPENSVIILDYKDYELTVHKIQ